MNRFACIAALLLLLDSPAMAEPDYSELQSAVKDFAGGMVRLDNEISAVDDAQGAKKAIDELTAATNSVCDKFDAVEKQHPELMQGPIPPDLDAIKEKANRVWTIHHATRERVAGLNRRFASDKEVDDAIWGLRQAMYRLGNLGEPAQPSLSRDVIDATIVSDGQSEDSPTDAQPVSTATPQTIAEWSKAAGQGDADCEARMGRCYYYGTPAVARDYRQALTWYEKAANQGNIEGMLMTAVAYEKGRGTDKNIPTAIKWYRAAADKGVALAGTELGIIYLSANGVPRDEEQGLKWLRKSVGTGEKHAEMALACCYYLGYGVPRDRAEGSAMLLKAAEDGLAIAQVSYGTALSHGDGVDLDAKAALDWYEKAAKQGQPLGEYAYGLACVKGTVRDIDLEESLRWFRAAALQGYSRGENAYGYALATGAGVPVDLVEAYKWYFLALSQRDDDDVYKVANVNIAAIVPQMTQSQIQEAKERAAHFVPVPELQQTNDVLEASEEMKQKSAAGATPPPNP